MTAHSSTVGTESPVSPHGRSADSPGVRAARIFDPLLPLDMHQYLAEIVLDTREEICCPMIWTPAINKDERQMGIWKCLLSDAELAAQTKAIRDVAKLPLQGPYRSVVLETWSDLEAAVEMRKMRMRGARNVGHRPATGGSL